MIDIEIGKKYRFKCHGYLMMNGEYVPRFDIDGSRLTIISEKYNTILFGNEIIVTVDSVWYNVEHGVHIILSNE